MASYTILGDTNLVGALSLPGGPPSGIFVGSITAHSGGGQGDAVQLPGSGMAHVTVVAAANDSVKLAAASNPGMELWVINDGNNDLAVYPASGESIIGRSANDPWYIHKNCRHKFISLDGEWRLWLHGERRVFLAGQQLLYGRNFGTPLEGNVTTNSEPHTLPNFPNYIPRSAWGLPVRLTFWQLHPSPAVEAWMMIIPSGTSSGGLNTTTEGVGWYAPTTHFGGRHRGWARTGSDGGLIMKANTLASDYIFGIYLTAYTVWG